jgi:hypothetical protein
MAWLPFGPADPQPRHTPGKKSSSAKNPNRSESLPLKLAASAEDYTEEQSSVDSDATHLEVEYPNQENNTSIIAVIDEDYDYERDIMPLLKSINVGKIIEIEHNAQSDRPDIYRIIERNGEIITVKI